MLTGYGENTPPPAALPAPVPAPSSEPVFAAPITVEPLIVERAPSGGPQIEVFMDSLAQAAPAPQPVIAQAQAPQIPAMRQPSGFLTAFETPQTPQTPQTGQVPQARALTGFPAQTPAAPRGDQAPVDLTADSLSHDDATNIITASGNVMLVQADRILRADEITYDLGNGEVLATGNVVLNEPNGDIHLSQKVRLSNAMKDGFVEQLYTQMADGSRLWAEDGTRDNATVITMNEARYTACVPCGEAPDATPAWQIKADKVIHNKDDKTIAYKNATLELFGVPSFYTPYFSHPDGSVDRKSGFLPPTLGYKSELGAFIGTQYYWNMARNRDATIGLMAMSEENPLLTAQYRQRWNKAALLIDSGITHSGRIDRSNGERIAIDDELRGHLFAEGLWDINRKWRAGFDIEYASDDQYLRQYDFDSEDVLENEIYAERFSGRNYVVGRLQKFQDLRIDNNVDQPAVLPELIASFIGEPGAVPLIGGRWDAHASFLGLQREGDEQDMNRAIVELGWKRRFVSDFGLVSEIDADLRGDLYNVRDLDPALNVGDSSTETRGFVQIHMQTSYPIQRRFEKFQARIEPIVSLSIAPNIKLDPEIPNEDSQDVQIDASNLFARSRFPGFDRVEDKSRVTYGVRTGLYGYDGSHINIFGGQSRRIEDEGNPFPAGSGLDTQESDYVGEISGTYKDNLWLNYRFQLDNDTLKSQRHEVDFYGTNKRFDLGARYLFAQALPDSIISESREQLEVYSGYYMTPRWRMRAGGTQDLGDRPGLREAFLGIDYFGECLFLSLTGERELTDDASGDSGTEILFRIGLKNLGGDFEESAYNPLGSCKMNNGI